MAMPRGRTVAEIAEVQTEEEADMEAGESMVAEEETEAPSEEPDASGTMEEAPEVEITEAPSEEPDIEETEAPTEGPVAESTVEPSKEPAETEEPVETPAETGTPQETPKANEQTTEEPTEELTEAPSEELAETPFKEVAEEPSQEPEMTQEPFEDTEELSITGMDGVIYLSKEEVKRLSVEELEEYITLCEMVASWIEVGEGFKDYVFSIDEEGNLRLSMSPSPKAGFVHQAEGISLEGAIADFGTEASFSATEINTLLGDKLFFKNQLNTAEKAIYNAAKKAIVDNGEKKFTYMTQYKKAADIRDDMEMDVIVIEDWMYYALSALINTYPAKFDRYKEIGDDVEWTIMLNKKTGKYGLELELIDIRKDAASLEKKAGAKVKAVVAEAKEYAKENNPTNPFYAMVEYFDNWLCQKCHLTSDAVDEEYGFALDNSYGPLIFGYGSEKGYALAMSRFLDAAGIRNMYVFGHGLKNSKGEYPVKAWNYVQMPDGNWYLLDSSMNDKTSTKDYLLTTRKEGYIDTGRSAEKWWRRYQLASKNFSFPELSSVNYPSGYEASMVKRIYLTESVLYLKPEKAHALRVYGENDNIFNETELYYIGKYEKKWTSDNPKVAKVNQNGKVTAGKASGKATITYTVAGQTKTCNVHVYKFSGLTFSDNNKSTFSQVFANPSTTTFDKNISKTITIKQSNKTASAWAIMNAKGLAKPSVTSSNKKVAEAVISGTNMNNPNGNDTITLVVKPKKIGTTKITVKFGGKTATYNLTVKYKINESWFDYSKIVDQTYSGKAYKPKVTKTKDATVTVPADLKYTVSYKNNINAGTATVTIKGTDNYADTITKNFKISPKDLNACKFTASTKSKSYNGKAQKAVTTVKDGKKILKAGTNYEVQYDVNCIWTATAPANTGIYKVRIVGKGNYIGTVDAPNTYEIKQIPLSKMVVSCPKEVKWKNGKPVTPPVKVKIGSSTLAAGPDYAIGYYKITKNSEGAEVRTAVSSSALCDKGNYVAVITRTKNGTNIDWGSTLTIEKKFKIKKMS